MIVYNQFRIIKYQEIMINVCNMIIVQTFKLMSRININFELRKRVHRNLTIFTPNYMKVLYIAIHQQSEMLVHY